MIFERLFFARHLEEGEKILYVVHRHWIDILKPSLEVAFFGFLIPWGLYALGFNSLLFFWLAVVWSVLAYIRYLFLFIDWYADAWVLTNNNLIDIEWKGIFHNESSRTEYQDIEGAGYEISGFWATVLGYGEMTVKVVSGNNLTMHHVNSPRKVELKVLHHQTEILEEKHLKHSEGINEILTEMVAPHMRKKLK